MSSTNLLPASLQNSLQEVVKLCNQSGADVRAITLSTTEGVPLGRVYGPNDEGQLNEETLSLMETVWAPASKQLPVLGLEKVHQITAMYDHGILMHLYWAPIVVTVLCGPESNLGAVRSTGIPLLKDVLGPLRTTLVESLKPSDEDEEAAAAAEGAGGVEDGGYYAHQ